MLRFVDRDIFIDQPSGDHLTLVYKNIITNGTRVQSVLHESWATPKMVSVSLAQRLAITDILILAPLLPDYSPSYVRQMCQALPDHAVKILLPQGYYRFVGPQGQIQSRLFKESDVILPLVDILIQSDEDSSDALAQSQKWATAHPHLTTVVTRNSDGLSAFTHDQSLSLPTEPIAPSDIVNPVGAGDVFSAELALSLYRNIPLQDALASAQHAAHQHISGKNSDGVAQNIVQ